MCLEESSLERKLKKGRKMETAEQQQD